MKVDHIGIATGELKQALLVWRDALGLSVDSTDEVASQGVRVAMLPIGEVCPADWQHGDKTIAEDPVQKLQFFEKAY